MLLIPSKILCMVFIIYLNLNFLIGSRIDLRKEFSGQDLNGIEFKSFRIPLSLILTATQEAREKNAMRAMAVKAITKKVPTEFVTSKPKKLLNITYTNITMKKDMVELTPTEPPVQIVTEEPPITFVVPIEVEYESENELVEVATVVSVEESDTEGIVEEVTTEPPQQDVVGQAARFPCQCVNGQCGCCTGVFLERISMKACGNISFVPEEFVFDMRFSVNNNTVLRRRVSASDPPPVCFNPRRAPFVEVCAELSNVHVKNRNAHACLDVDANVAGFSVYSTSFRCFSLGSSGIKTGLKPKPIKKPAGAPAATNLFGNNEDDDDDDEGLLGGDGLLGDGGGIFGGGDGDGGGLFGGGDGGVDSEGGIFGGGGDDGGGVFGGGDGDGIFGGGDEGDFEGPDFDGALESAGDFLGS